MGFAMQRRHRRVILIVLAVIATLPMVAQVAPVGAGSGQICPTYGSKTETGRIEGTTITEASGLAASRAQRGIFWTHNDSGGKNEVYAINQSGDVLMTVRFGDHSARDMEDIAIGPGPGPGDYIYVGDIGDNSRSRSTVQIYRFKEPRVTSGTISVPGADVERFDYTYENPSGGTRKRNAESLAVDPISGDVIIVEKELATVNGLSRVSWVYRIKQSSLREGTTLRAEAMVTARTSYEGEARPPTAADFSADGRLFVVKNGYEVFSWMRSPGQSIYAAIREDRSTGCLYRGSRGEAVAVAADNSALFFVREGTNSPIERTRLTIPSIGATCNGWRVTIRGTAGADTIRGTSGPDVIHGFGGNDTIDGLQGDDIICGGRGADVIDGGSGVDRIFAGLGHDRVRGGSGGDRIFGGWGADTLIGEDGRDYLFGVGGDDSLWGGRDYDRLFGGDGDDSCDTGPDGGTTSSC